MGFSDDDNNRVFLILKLSFDHLPTPSLKQCFAYCANFQDYNIRKEEVIQHWMAKGFLESSKGSCTVMEDIGDMYFNILLASSFFQDARKDVYGNIISCKMCDLVHDLVLSIIKSETLILERASMDNVHTRFIFPLCWPNNTKNFICWRWFLKITHLSFRLCLLWKYIIKF